jgi:pyruvate formate lyase activating enzyme
MIFDIQRFSTHDGKGIRSTVFFKGCPLRCTWCENPESQSYAAELLYDPARCILCLECTRVGSDSEISSVGGKLQIRRERIGHPELYRTVCPANALQVVGQERSVEEILREIEKDLPFYRKSGGGVTFSGGEPYGQPDLLMELLRGLKRLDIRTAVETSLQAAWKHISPSLPYVDTFLADVKHTDAGKFKEFTAGNLGLIQENFRRLADKSARVVARVPVIPGFNDSAEEMRRILDFVSSLDNIREINFLPYHVLGVHKYSLMGRGYDYLTHVPDWDKRLQEYERLARDKGLETNIGG